MRYNRRVRTYKYIYIHIYYWRTKHDKRICMWCVVYVCVYVCVWWGGPPPPQKTHFGVAKQQHRVVVILLFLIFNILL